MKIRLVHGVGVNDSKGTVFKMIDGKSSICPFYAKWQNMLKRCYKSNDSNDSSYQECEVCDDWLTFSNFRGWMKNQDWKGKELDKDILSGDGKIYSPETCIFVSKKINSMIRVKANKILRGVSLVQSTGKFVAHCHNGERLVSLGTFSDKNDAHKAYIEFKTDRIKEVAKLQDEPLKTALNNYTVV